MNKEVTYILQGFLLTLVVLAFVGMGQFLFSMAEREEVAKNTSVGVCGNAYIPKIQNTHGMRLFKDNCASCHSVAKDMTGPALKDVTLRITDKKLLYNWIRNSAAVLKTGNPYFKDLVKQYQVVMMPFPDLRDDEIEAILDFIEH